MSSHEDVHALKLTTDPAGVVWYADGWGEVTCSGQAVPAFLRKLRRPFVRLPGLAHNAALLVALYEAFRDRRVERLEVCSPAAVPTREQRHDPRLCLFHARRCDRPASAGGWRPVTVDDFRTFSLVLAAGDGADHAVRLLRDHPTGPLVRFLEGLDRAAFAAVLAEVLDPRWFVDPRNPDRLARLRCYFGVVPGHAPKPRRRLLDQAWSAGGRPADTAAPGRYLWRYYDGRRLRRDDVTHEAAVAATSRRFLTLVALVWLDRLHPMPNRWREPLFEPEHFFDTPAAVAAFRRCSLPDPDSD